MTHICMPEMRSPDPYHTAGKPHAPGHCPVCGAVQLQGRWQWPTLATMVAGAERLCPACRRVAEANPAGLLHVTGPFARAHRDEIMALCRREARLESGRHPLNRILAIDSDDESLLVATTDTHLPERLGHALHRAYRGDVHYRHDAAAAMVRVDWRR